MNEDELKSLYRESSSEVPDSRVDDLILAQAAEALEEKSAKADTWRPYLATAASVTLVVALAIQLTPEQQLEIEQTLAPTEPLTMQAPPRPAAKDKSELVESLAADIEAPKPLPQSPKQNQLFCRIRLMLKKPLLSPDHESELPTWNCWLHKQKQMPPEKRV